MSNPPSKTSAHIPVVSDLVVPGNPALRRQGDASGNKRSSRYADALNSRIDELESAIGQDTMGTRSRAFAIRAEASRSRVPPAKKLNAKRTKASKDLS
ncbi:MAG: hypothetical protein ACPG47_00195 [Leucothrix sp.]